MSLFLSHPDNRLDNATAWALHDLRKKASQSRLTDFEIGEGDRAIIHRAEDSAHHQTIADELIRRIDLFIRHIPKSPTRWKS